MYVDDVLFGAHDIDYAISLAQELSDLLIAGGFPLRKWTANHSDLLKHLPVILKLLNRLLMKNLNC